MDYLLKSMLCLLVLLLIHRVLLQREVLHRFNRFFLLASVIGSFLIPLVTIEVRMEKVEPVAFEAVALAENETLEYEDFSAVEEGEVDEAIAEDEQVKDPVSITSFPWEKALWIAYFAISAAFLFRFLRNLGRLLQQIRINPHLTYRDETLVLYPEKIPPFSFLKYIFVSRTCFEAAGISDAVFAHERCHVRERHSWDVLLVEALLVPFWFHPALYLARHAIQLNHEFIADQAALGATSVKDYQHQLLSILLDRPSQSMVSSLNFSLTKKRMQMMNKKTGSPLKWLKLLVLVPLIGALVYFFGEKVAVQPEKEGVQSQIPVAESLIEEVEMNIKILSDRLVEVDGQPVPIAELSKWLDEIKASQPIVRFSANPGVEMGTMADVQEILRDKEIRQVVFETQIREEPQSEAEQEKEIHYRNAYILLEDENMQYTHKSYGQLTEEEKEKLLGPIKIQPTGSPDPALYEKWKDNQNYAIWIDGGVIENERLNAYSAVDFGGFLQSRVMQNARSKRFPQPFQVHLYTHNFYKELGPKKPLTEQDTITLTQRRATWHKDIQRYPDRNTAFLQKNARYEKLRTSGTIYSQKSPEEKALLDSLYHELDSLYTSSSSGRKKYIKKPIAPDSDSPRNGGSSQNSSEKIAVRNNGSLGGEELVYEFASSNGGRSAELQEYLALYGKYQTITYQNRLFEQPVIFGVLHQQEIFKELEAKYNRLSFEERRRVKRAAFPYVKLEKDGKEVFVKIEDLTPQQRKELGC
jgi:biopolymer transport protein ExbD